MKLAKLEVWVHDHVLKNDKIRQFAYGAYQRTLCAVSKTPKSTGDMERVTPDDGYEYLFGYYDKCPWSPSGRYLLALRVKNATAHADSTALAEIVRVDMPNNQAVETVATTHAWNVQQGCMAQWLDEDTLLFNDFRDNQYCAVIRTLSTKTDRTIPQPIYALSSDKKTALSLDFSRLHALRPGYGYANKPEATAQQSCPDAPCIWKIDLQSGAVTPLLKYTDFFNFETKPDMIGAQHKVNHLMIAPDGQRFMVLHRWLQGKVKHTRLVTCNMDGTGLYNVSDDDFVSHCCWKSNDEIVSYLNKAGVGKGYYWLRDQTVECKPCWSQLVMDGHPSYSPDGQRVVTDTYPDRKRMQSLYIMAGNAVKCVAQVFSPFKYGGDTRCDLHPRWNNDGTMVCFDAAFEGKRAVYQMKIAASQSDTHPKPLVSIVIPTHNRETLLPRAISSALTQTYSNIEIIVVSDGSTDGTDQLVHEIQQHNKRVHYISYHPGRGGNVARNLGIQRATGEYVAFLDDDDVWRQDKLEEQVRIVSSDETIGLVCTGMCSITEGENSKVRFIPPALYDSSKAILLRNCIGSTTTVMVKRSLFDKVGMFDEQLGALQDYDMWVRLCQITKVGVVKKPCVDYYNYTNSNQISKNTDKYEKSVVYINKKYSDLVSSLTSDEQKYRKSYFLLLVAKKAMKNDDPKRARKFVVQAGKVKITSDVCLSYVASFFPQHRVNQVLELMRKVKARIRR